LLNLGLSGFAMSGADVGGFAATPQPELLTRWLELGAFQPIDRDHTALGTGQQEPWENGSLEDLDLRRRYIEERYRLMPYLYTTAEEMSRTGLPIMRPMFLEFPGEASGRQLVDPAVDNNFMLGPDLLVAESPYPDEMDNYSVALPPVGWYDYWTGAAVEGSIGHVNPETNQVRSEEVHIQRSLDTLPVFVRAGAIIPEQPVVQSTEEKPEGPLTLRVYPPTGSNKDCTGSLYLDDGVSYDFEKGQFLREQFTCRLSAQGITVTIASPEGSFSPWWNVLSIEIYGATKPATAASISAPNGRGTAQVTTAYDAEHHRITALIPDTGKGLEMQLAF
jgi:alpha-glucosidase